MIFIILFFFFMIKYLKRIGAYEKNSQFYR